MEQIVKPTGPAAAPTAARSIHLEVQDITKRFGAFTALDDVSLEVESGKLVGQWQNGERYARNMIGDFRHWVCGFLDWNIVLDQRGGPNHVGNFCDAPVIVNTETKQVSYGSSFYYIAQFSRFVQPGAHRIASHGGPEALQSVAFANPDGSLVSVVLNETDASVNFTLSVGDETLTCAIPAHAIQTYVRSAR